MSRLLCVFGKLSISPKSPESRMHLLGQVDLHPLSFLNCKALFPGNGRRPVAFWISPSSVAPVDARFISTSGLFGRAGNHNRPLNHVGFAILCWLPTNVDKAWPEGRGGGSVCSVGKTSPLSNKRTKLPLYTNHCLARAQSYRSIPTAIGQLGFGIDFASENSDLGAACIHRS